MDDSLGMIIASKEEFRTFLSLHAFEAKEVWVKCVKCKPCDGVFIYLDAVEVALCFGWIDSVHKSIDGIELQRFSPRKKGSYWTELNKERCRRLIKLGFMSKEGYKSLPNLGPRSFKPDEDVIKALKKARVYSKFKTFHPLYQRIRLYNVAFYKNIDMKLYQSALSHLIEMTKLGKMYGNWNDYGRLLDY